MRVKRYAGWLLLASHLKMSLSRCLKEVSHREYLMWMEWLKEQWNAPDRTDHYLMQIAAEIKRGRVKNPKSVQLKHAKIEFSEEVPKKDKAEGAPVVNQENLARMLEAQWRARLGM